MRAVLLVVALAGCGRIGYDPIESTAGDDDAGDDDDSGVCPTGYSERDGRCWKVVTAPQPWPVAEADCEDDGPGTHLPVIVDAPHHFVLHDLAGQAGFAEVWLGYTDRVTEGTFRWVAAGGIDPLTDQCFWGPAGPGPRNSALDDCTVQLGQTQCGDWFLRDCAAARPYVCEHDGRSPDPGSY